jgi:hypothetical protein
MSSPVRRQSDIEEKKMMIKKNLRKQPFWLSRQKPGAGASTFQLHENRGTPDFPGTASYSKLPKGCHPLPQESILLPVA